MEPLRPRLVRHAQLAKVGVKRLVREALSGAIVKDGSPLPLQLRQCIGGVCLLLDASLYILLLGVSDFCPSVVVCDLRRGVGKIMGNACFAVFNLIPIMPSPSS